MRIGHNVRRYREKKGWKQESLAEKIGMSQSNLSNIESNKQDATWEQIQAIALALEVNTKKLTAQKNPVFNSNHQQGGHANNYIVHNGAEAALAAKDEVIAAKNEMIAILHARVLVLESELQTSRKG
ncbi:MAG: helix-turn-helix domain-containing protein [Saprospiraceae bacterium]